jgi:hypothetical protein
MVVECGETSNPINRNEESLPGRRDPTTRKPGIWSRPVVRVEQPLMMVGFIERGLGSSDMEGFCC